MTASLRVLVDGRALVGNRTGIGVHTAAIASRLDVTPVPIIASHAPIADREAIGHCVFRVDEMRPGVLWQQFTLPDVAGEERADVVWGPHGTLPLTLRTPAVVTVHDLTSITMPHRHRLKTVLSFNIFIARSLEMAREVACVSQATADAVLRGFGVPSGKITIVPNGVDDFFSPGEDALPPELEGEPFILFAGTIEPRKGVATLLDAWEGLKPQPRLVLCGDAGWGSAKLRQRLAKSGTRAVVTGFVERRLLRALYRRAAAFIYPSRYEGFGLPPLEAMACGTPVVTTRAGALGEVVADAAVTVAPDDPLALRRAIAGVLGDVALRNELVARGIARARRYRWEASAELMTELLTRATGKRWL
jgi:glycosyltransferase involved in cell wall biosynthesis